MATDDLASPAADPGPASTARSTDALSIRTMDTLKHSNPETLTHQDDPAPFDIVHTYHDLLASDPEMTMPVAAIESLIDLLRATPSSTAMETVEVVRKEKAKLLESTPNPLPLLAGADLFEQYLLRSLRGQTTTGGADERVLSFDETRSHLLHNRQLFAHRARAARDSIAAWGSKYVVHGRVVLAAGGSRTVTKILLRAAADPTRHFKVICVVDGSERAEASVDALRAAGLEVETISPNKVAYMLANQSRINLVLVGTEVVMQNGGIISRMGTCQLAHLTKSVKGSLKRFYVAAETHKIVRKTALAYPMVNRVGISQKDVSKWENLGNEDVEDLGAATQRLLSEQDEVDYTDPELIDGIITEQGVKMTSQIWEMVDDYI
ncbi:hypothetical protein B0H67DRAFT_601137 [Lasiosphaeris hirsuta]|uniref:Translation initiation factor eIF2B subunit alpha n=1 Tax=Lasiosphaeris hirsuta TaxID=260670 RepID=A0AA40AGY4_9PEZI|nr:hypothetical protein B0H67DRAFT_601137 [Lasiosphaeris hirsuta]